MEIQSYKGTYGVEFSKKKPTLDGIIVIDRNVYDKYYDCKIGLSDLIIVESGEGCKTLESSQNLINLLLERNFKKNTKITAIGGGVVQDLVSFTTSILYRGVDWEFIPTTLLAQCDSCIGSKTSINYNKYKNLLGGFHPPKKITIWKGFLKSLEERDIKSGVGEMLHYFLLNNKLDISKKLVEDRDVVGHINKYIRESLSIKKLMIEKDEFDKGERNLFNYGHTFGHAIETLSNYEVNHGQAVTMGMGIANWLSFNKSLITKEKHEQLKTILSKNMPDYSISETQEHEYLEILKRDKKNVSDELTCILLNNTYGEKIAVKYEEVLGIIRGLRHESI